ncbi:MAG: phage GP46 family protein [Geobacteraceae bacterium]|nr:phage GP46 family protein [Geobacteraceae bacterium]
MSFGITTYNGLLQMTLDGGDDLLTNVILSLEITQGSFFADPAFGLLNRPRLKNTDRTAQLIKSDIQNALQWLLDTKRAPAINISMQRDVLIDKTRLMARVSVTGPQGNTVTYDKFVEVV